MSKYDEITKEFDYCFRNRNIDIDDFDEKSLTIVSYEDLDSDDLIEIEEHIFGFAKPVLMDISPRIDESDNSSYVLLTYKANIGEDEFSDDELQESKEDREDRLYHEAKDESVI
jgi:hypothetical protein